jgi:hypothetical protein
VHLLAALDHHDGAVLAQRQVDGAPGEVPAFQPLLAGLDLAGVVVTADALCRHRDNASYDEVVVTKGYGSSWILGPCLTWANAPRRVQHPAFSLVCRGGGRWPLVAVTVPAGSA